MKTKYSLCGTLQSKELEREFLESKWNANKNYLFLSYFLCCFFFVLAGIFGDLQRTFYIGSYEELMIFRVVLLSVFFISYFLYRKSEKRPKSIEYWLDSMKYISTITIVLLTYWTKGTSLTLLPGIMMMVFGFYMILPGKIASTNICAFSLLLTFIFLQDYSLMYGHKVHNYMVFMLFSIEVLLCIFKIKYDRLSRIEFLSKRELAVLNKTKDRLMATIGHDIRSPLAIIMSRAELSLVCLEDNETQEVKTSQEVIIKSIIKLDKLLSDLVNWALSELKEGKETREIYCINQTVQDALDFILEQAKEKKVSMVKDVEPYPYFHEPRMLTTCIRNILSNAIKYNPLNSEIKIVGRVLDDKYCLDFYDEGPGMSEELMDNIEKGLNLVSSPGSEGERGTGLGLKLVKNIIDKNNGEISISPNSNGGTLFSIILPLESGDTIA